jgi:hypothetical protein
MADSSSSSRRILPSVRALTAVAGILVVIAGLQLFALAPDTERVFAWTIKPPLTAAFLGASYWASVFLLIGIVFGSAWRPARAPLISVLVFTTVSLIVTLLHLDKFHFSAPETLPIVAAWAWLVVYVVTPPAFGLAIWAEARASGSDPPRFAPLPPPLRVLFFVQVVIFGLLALALLFVPSWAQPVWPWPLTPLTAGAISAWLAAIAVVGIGVLIENDRQGIANSVESYAFLGALQLLAVLRFASDLDWSHPLAWPYVVFWVVVLVTGVWGAVIARR